jgi:pimeloyl-ACP methyl ester carboxylesterase
METSKQLNRLRRPEGVVAYECSGTGPLVVCVPGMGDLRASYRYLEPALATAGYRVAVTDLRGHGDSSPVFSAYGDEPTADDIAALIEHLSGPAVIVGNSMAAGSAVLVAAQHPELVSALVLIGPFVRDHSGPLGRLATRALMAP